MEHRNDSGNKSGTSGVSTWYLKRHEETWCVLCNDLFKRTFFIRQEHRRCKLHKFSYQFETNTGSTKPEKKSIELKRMFDDSALPSFVVHIIFALENICEPIHIPKLHQEKQMETSMQIVISETMGANDFCIFLSAPPYHYRRQCEWCFARHKYIHHWCHEQLLCSMARVRALQPPLFMGCERHENPSKTRRQTHCKRKL